MSGDEEKAYPGFSGRLQFIGVVLALCMLILIFRLWTLQIVHWDEYRSQSNSNRLRPQRLESPRGVIYGRDGLKEKVVLAELVEQEVEVHFVFTCLPMDPVDLFRTVI